MIKMLSRFKLKPRHQWFSQISADAEEGWYGPCKTIEDAFIECLSAEEQKIVYIAQGRKLTRQEQEEWGVEFSWQVEKENLIQLQEIYIFKGK